MKWQGPRPSDTSSPEAGWTAPAAFTHMKKKQKAETHMQLKQDLVKLLYIAGHIG